MNLNQTWIDGQNGNNIWKLLLKFSCFSLVSTSKNTLLQRHLFLLPILSERLAFFTLCTITVTRTSIWALYIPFFSSPLPKYPTGYKGLCSWTGTCSSFAQQSRAGLSSSPRDTSYWIKSTETHNSSELNSPHHKWELWERTLSHNWENHIALSGIQE